MAKGSCCNCQKKLGTGFHHRPLSATLLLPYPLKALTEKRLQLIEYNKDSNEDATKLSIPE